MKTIHLYPFFFPLFIFIFHLSAFILFFFWYNRPAFIKTSPEGEK